MKKISDLDQDHLKASPFECIEISVHKCHAVGFQGWLNCSQMQEKMS